ncbi:MAG: PHP domain-containing protein [Heliobacteriaceae bacterium]|jgi:predicted metal-dependent phosphoesterase TrpH|nr:PHP domain-containing protein [Heliobacteriaceae bacterium]
MDSEFKELISSFTKEDYENGLVDLHIHTTFSDGTGDIRELAAQAEAMGYKYIAFCDHNTVEGYRSCRSSIVIPAAEFDVWCGCVFLHLLAYGIDVNSEELKPFFAKTKRETEADWVRIFAKRDIKKLINAIHTAGGIAVLAHPACCWTLSLDRLVKKLVSYGLDGIEVYYPYRRHRGIIKFHYAGSVEKIADKYNLIKTGGTDLHGKKLHNHRVSQAGTTLPANKPL